MRERIWIDSDTGKITWAHGEDMIPVFVFDNLWMQIEPRWSGLQHSINKFKN